MPDLTDADRAAIAAIREQTASSSESERAEFIYRAGLAAGRAVTIEEAAQVVERKGGANSGRYAAAIRAINAPAAP